MVVVVVVVVVVMATKTATLTANRQQPWNTVVNRDDDSH